jgi:hypothetical protein
LQQQDYNAAIARTQTKKRGEVGEGAQQGMQQRASVEYLTNEMIYKNTHIMNKVSGRTR